MKKLSLAYALLVSAVVFGSQALAQDKNKGGFVAPQTEIITVEQANGMGDDAFVMLKGKISKALGDEMYVFTDSTGDIVIEIDEDDWNGQNIGPDDVVIITGEIDKGFTTVEIDVDEITLAQ